MKKTASRAKKIWTVLANAILVFLILIGAVVAVTLLPIKDNYKILSVMSGSMEPTISTGDLIVIKPEKTYQINNIVTFKPLTRTDKKEDYTTHRIFDKKIENGGQTVYKTKGDANEESDFESIGEDRIIGKHKLTVALIGYLVAFIKTLPGLILIVIIPAAIIIYEEVNKIKREARRMIDQKKKKHKHKEGKK